MSKSALPESYLAAKAALRLCAKHFTPATYFAARAALEGLVANDDVEAITDDAGKLAAYAAIAKDNELERLTAAISRKHRKWKETA